MTFGYVDKWGAGTRLIIEDGSGGTSTFGIGVTHQGATSYVDVTKEDAAQVALAILEAAGYTRSFMGGEKGGAAVAALAELAALTQISPLVHDIDKRLRGVAITPAEADHLISSIKARTRS